MTSDDRTEKDRQLDAARVGQRGSFLTTDQGIPVDDTDNSLKAGERGPTLMEDFHFREKITHFDHERIPSGSCTPGARARTVSSSPTTIRWHP